MNIATLAGRLRSDERGVAFIEFAFAIPVLVFVLMGSMEFANYARVRHQIGQLALQVADNASRIGNEGIGGPQPLREAQINDVLLGVEIQGEPLDIEAHGRIILSSLEQNDDDGQWLRWQRCVGSFSHPSSYGVEGDGETGTSFPGMGPPDNLITSDGDNAVMFVEIAYDYQPLFKATLLPVALPEGPIVETAAMMVRNDRNTADIENGDGAIISDCA